jgi:hypothetical protein
VTDSWGFVSEPGTFDPLETWEQWLAEVQAWPDSLLKANVIESAKWVIEQKKQNPAHRARWRADETLLRSD